MPTLPRTETRPLSWAVPQRVRQADGAVIAIARRQGINDFWITCTEGGLLRDILREFDAFPVFGISVPLGEGMLVPALGLACQEMPGSGSWWACSGEDVSCREVANGVLVESSKERRLFLVAPSPPSADPRVATTRCFREWAEQMATLGFDAEQLTRTWFYNREILVWYAAFNDARREAFVRNGFGRRHLPASTGIGAPGPRAPLLAGTAFAVMPQPGLPGHLREVESPLQGPAPAYGSLFSRGIAWDGVDHRSVWVSGTASILPDGTTWAPGDAARQVALTLDVVEALLASEGLGWQHVVRSIAYVRNPEDSAQIMNLCRERDLDLPLLLVSATICRADLLFELEVDAVGLRSGVCR